MTLLDDETLASGDLSVFDTVVVGIQSFGPRSVANHDRLLQYVTQGGTLIVQYQQVTTSPGSSRRSRLDRRRIRASSTRRPRSESWHLRIPS